MVYVCLQNNLQQALHHKPKAKNIKTKKQRNKIHEIKKKLNENKQREKYLQKNISFLFLTPNHSQFLQKGMQRGSTRFFNK